MNPLMILMIDNYDSFTYNIVQYFGELKQDITVWRNDQTSIEQIQILAPDIIVIGPGTCDPDRAGISLEVIDTFIVFQKRFLVHIPRQTDRRKISPFVVLGKSR